MLLCRLLCLITCSHQRAEGKTLGSRGSAHMTKGSFLLFLLFLICKVNGQLPPLALEAQPSVVQGHVCRAKSLCFWQSHELTWALVRKRPRPHVAEWNIRPPRWLRVTHQTRGMSKHAISCRVRAFFWLSLEPPKPTRSRGCLGVMKTAQRREDS